MRHKEIVTIIDFDEYIKWLWKINRESIVIIIDFGDKKVVSANKNSRTVHRSK